MDYSQYSLAKTGYLKEDFRLFHINDRTDREFEWHYHDFHKIIVFVSGKVTYHIEGKHISLSHRIFFLSVRGQSTNPRLIHLYHMSAIFSGSEMTCHPRNSTPAFRKPMTEASISFAWTLLSRKNLKISCQKLSIPCAIHSLAIPFSAKHFLHSS